MTGLWAFEWQMPFQKYHGSAIVVRWFTTQQEVLSVWVPFFSSKEFSEMLNNMSHAYFLSNIKELSTSDVQDDLNII